MLDNMQSKDLGLPIEYQLYPEYFDTPSNIYNTAEKNAVIEDLCAAYGVKTVLDMTCGTGAQVFYLANKGYQVIGSDFSPGLIKIAQEKALRKNMQIEFINGDMRNVHIGRFDSVITIDNAIGHLVQEDFEIALGNIYNNLKTQGIYIFDILNLDAMTDEVTQSDSSRMSDERTTTDGTIIRKSRRSYIDKTNGYTTSEDDITICKEGDEKRIQNKCSLKIYTMQQIQSILEKNNFTVLEQNKVDAYTFEKDDNGYSIITVAQKL